MSSVEKVPSNTGKSSPAVVDEKEKTSVDVHDGGSSQGEQAPVLGYSTPALRRSRGFRTAGSSP